MTLIFIFGVGFYFLLMALIGYFASRRVKTMEDYLVAGRRLPFYLALPTIVATWFGAGSSMGVSGTVYSEGFYGVIADPFGCSLALLIAGLFFAAPFRRLRLLTISDLLGNAYGPSFERVSTLIVLPFYIGTLASQMLAMGYVFQIVSGISFEIGILIGALIVVSYTVSGGMWAVTITDFIQFGLLTLGLIIIVPICLEQVQDRQAVFNTFLNEFSTVIPQSNGSSSVDWLSYAGRILMTGLGAIMGQDLLQRFLASRSEKIARYSGVVGAFTYLLLGLIPLFIGIAGREIYPALEKPEHLIPLLAKEFLSPIAFMLFACGLFSAIMSTADSYLLAGTTLVTNNVLLKIWPVSNEKKKLSVLRWVNIFIALTALALAFSGQSIFNMMVHSGTTLFVAIFVPATAALFWKGANLAAAWSSLIGGTASWLGFLYFNPMKYNGLNEDFLFSAAAFGALFSLFAYIIVSLYKFFQESSQKQRKEYLH
ncbi:MAG: sodium:solute symporter family protein [Parachlamydiaceae bacterium]|nr:sodium:solute symporter family protein [Parachlamydiaceae bacterium]